MLSVSFSQIHSDDDDDACLMRGSMWILHNWPLHETCIIIIIRMNLIKTNTVHCVKFVFSTSRLLGFLSFDVDVSRLDINQCDDSLTSKSTLQLQTFKDTHKCHSETSQVRNWINLKKAEDFRAVQVLKNT